MAISVIASIASLNYAYAQIQYSSEGLLIGNISQKHLNYGITAAVNGIYFKTNNVRFFQLDVTPADGPKIAGHNNEVTEIGATL